MALISVCEQSLTQVVFKFKTMTANTQNSKCTLFKFYFISLFLTEKNIKNTISQNMAHLHIVWRYLVKQVLDTHKVYKLATREYNAFFQIKVFSRFHYVLLCKL